MSDNITEDNDFRKKINYNPNDNAQLTEEDYLKNYEFQFLSLDSNNNQNIENKFENISSLINQEKISNIKDFYNGLDINVIYQNYENLEDSNIGSLVPFKYYIQLKYYGEENFKELLKLDISHIEIDKFRKIKGDGNCFYRSYIFSFIENIILTNNKELMKEIFIKFNNFYENDQYRNYNINFEEIKIILYIIIEFMLTDNNNSTAFLFFQKAYLFSESFDDGIVLFMRYLIKEYLSINNNKYYSTKNSVPIGSLLPEEYIKENNYLFDEYYKNDLMKMNEEAKDIAIYVSPFVLNCDLNIYELNYNNQNNMVICPNILLNSSENSFFFINLIYDSKIMHYDLVYTRNFYTQYINYLRVLTESKYQQLLNEQIFEQQMHLLYLQYLEKNVLLILQMIF